jgi:hypothetical protein
MGDPSKIERRNRREDRIARPGWTLGAGPLSEIERENLLRASATSYYPDAKCRDEDVEACAHEASLVDDAVATPTFGASPAALATPPNSE